MSRSRVVTSLLAVVVMIVIQTTVFGAGGIQPLGVAPALVTLVVILVANFIEIEYHLLLGFTAGILIDLVGSGTLGLWAMTLTIVAYAASRLSTQLTHNAMAMGGVVFGLTVAGQIVFVLMSTIFGQNTIAEPQLLQKIFLPAVWNLALAYPTMWLLKLVFKPTERGWAI
ncbi:MAG: rod shape-determining protein MreD [Actinomycetota bacterium]